MHLFILWGGETTDLQYIRRDTVGCSDYEGRRNENSTTAVEAAKGEAFLHGDLPGIGVAGGIGTSYHVTS